MCLVYHRLILMQGTCNPSMAPENTVEAGYLTSHGYFATVQHLHGCPEGTAEFTSLSLSEMSSWLVWLQQL